MLKELGSTGDVAVDKSLGLNSNEAMEFIATAQAADQPNIPPPDNVLVPPASAGQPTDRQPENTGGAAEEAAEDREPRSSQKADSQNKSQQPADGSQRNNSMA